MVSIASWAIGVQLQPDSLVLLVHCQDMKIIPRPRGLVSWLPSGQTNQPTDQPVFEPWSHVDHTGVECGCRSSDRTGAYAHAVVFDHPTSICELTPVLSHQARQIMGMCYRAGIQPVSLVYLCHRVMGSLRCGPVWFRSCLTEPVHIAGCSWQLMNA